MQKKILFFAITSLIVIATIVPITIYLVNKSKTPNKGGFSWAIPSNATFIGDSIAKITYMVPMRDGVKLATDVYVPTDINGSMPVLLVRTPYNKNALSLLSAYVYSKVIVVIQDIRGFFASEGELTLPFFTEHNDGHDTINWISSQQWCNGKVATWGPSALGIAQYLAAPNAPGALKAQVPIVALPDVYYALFTGGELRRELVLPWMQNQGFPTESLQNILQHEKKDSFWNIGRITGNYSQIHVPALHIGGWYDIFTSGTVEAFMGYQYHGGDGARGNSKLIMGPWVHEGMFGKPTGNITYPNQDIGLLITVSNAVFNAWLLGDFSLWDQLPTVAFYLMSSLKANTDLLGNRWFQSDSWPLKTNEQQFFLYENGSLIENVPTSSVGSLSYMYDPSNPVPTIGGGNLNIDAGAYDQQAVETRNDVLTFTTQVLTKPVTVIGSINVSLFISSNCTDTDFTVKLTDVYPDNTSMLITDTIIRARNRNGYDRWDFLEPGQIYEINLQLDPTAYVFNKGHRIRIDISSSNYPRFEPNPNTGDPMWKNSTYYIANNTVYTNKLHPSNVKLPVVNYSNLVPYEFPKPTLNLKFVQIMKSKKLSLNSCSQHTTLFRIEAMDVTTTKKQ